MSEDENNSTDMQELFTSVTGTDTLTESQEEDDERLRGDEADSRPTTKTTCPECGHDRAYYEMKQIRAADESETRFFECVDCGYKWREDDH